MRQRDSRPWRPGVISIVIPCYNEEQVLPALVPRLREVMDTLDETYEVVFVDDGSTDDTRQMLSTLCREWPEVSPISLARNVGHQIALTAGLDAAKGDYVISLDADLQDPPELIPDMVHLARSENLDVVYAQRTDRRSDTWFKRWTASVYYRMIKRVADVDLPPNVGDYRLLSRRVIDALALLPERHRVYRLLVPWLNFPSGTVVHRREQRAAGETKYSLRKMLLLTANSLASFTTSPLHIATTLGLTIGAVCALGAVGAIVAYLLGATVPGWASITVAVLFLSATQLVCLGMLGAYIGRIFEEVQRRPLYRRAAPREDEGRFGEFIQAHEKEG